MANPDSISQETIEQLDLILTCIASNARTIKTLSYEILESGDNVESVGALADALECVASNVGYMAEEGLGKLGSPRNDAGHWFLPPLLQNAGKPKNFATDNQQTEGGAHHA